MCVSFALWRLVWDEPFLCALCMDVSIPSIPYLILPSLLLFCLPWVIHARPSPPTPFVQNTLLSIDILRHLNRHAMISQRFLESMFGAGLGMAGVHLYT